MYIAIAGNIGSGKTTLTQILTKRYDAKCYLEECDNPYIGDFYEDMNRWAFNLQISFLGSRIQQTMDMLADNRDSGAIFQDRTIYEDAHIFADNLHEMGLMASRDIETYMKLFRLMTTLIPKPDLLIYLKASVPTLISTTSTKAMCWSSTKTMRISSPTLRCWRRYVRASMRSKTDSDA